MGLDGDRIETIHMAAIMATIYMCKNFWKTLRLKGLHLCPGVIYGCEPTSFNRTDLLSRSMRKSESIGMNNKGDQALESIKVLKYVVYLVS